jgi:hypothetical protein
LIICLVPPLCLLGVEMRLVLMSNRVTHNGHGFLLCWYSVIRPNCC